MRRRTPDDRAHCYRRRVPRAGSIGRPAIRALHPTVERSPAPGLAQILVDAEIPVATTVAPWSPPVFAARGEAYPEWRRTRHDGRLENVRLLGNAGVTLAFGTDSPEALRPSSLLTEATLLNRVLSSTEVLALMTRNAAVYLGLSHEIGTLEPGKLADIVILDGDPILDIANLGNVQLVVKARQNRRR